MEELAQWGYGGGGLGSPIVVGLCPRENSSFPGNLVKPITNFGLTLKKSHVFVTVVNLGS